VNNNKVRIKLCEQARAEHSKSCRQFAHVFHKPKTICVCPEFYNLPQSFQVGILLHEIGHLGFGPEENHTENEADRIAFYLSGVQVFRRRYAGMNRLETVRREDIGTAKDFLRQYISDRPIYA